MPQLLCPCGDLIDDDQADEQQQQPCRKGAVATARDRLVEVVERLGQENIAVPLLTDLDGGAIAEGIALYHGLGVIQEIVSCTKLLFMKPVPACQDVLRIFKYLIILEFGYLNPMLTVTA